MFSLDTGRGHFPIDFALTRLRGFTMFSTFQADFRVTYFLMSGRVRYCITRIVYFYTDDDDGSKKTGHVWRMV